MSSYMFGSSKNFTHSFHSFLKIVIFSLNYSSSEEPNETDTGYDSNNTDENSLDECYYRYHFDDDETSEHETQWKTIPLRDYIDLKEHVTLTKKLTIAIDKMKKQIQSKDLELHTLRQAYQRLQSNSVDLANLSTVSIISM